MRCRNPSPMRKARQLRLEDSFANLPISVSENFATRFAIALSLQLTDLLLDVVRGADTLLEATLPPLRSA